MWQQLTAGDIKSLCQRNMSAAEAKLNNTETCVCVTITKYTEDNEKQWHTTADHDISERTSAVGPETEEWEYQSRCLDSPQPQACPDGRNDCSPSIHRPQSLMRTLERCSLFDHCWPDEPSRHDIRIWNELPKQLNYLSTNEWQLPWSQRQ